MRPQSEHLNIFINHINILSGNLFFAMMSFCLSLYSDLLVLINSHVVLAHISSFHLLAVCSVFSPEEGARVAVRKISHGRTSFEVGVGLAVVLSRKKKKKSETFDISGSTWPISV